MKKRIIQLCLTLLLVLPLVVAKADTTNNNGVVMSASDYYNLRKLYSEEYIATMTQDDYNRIMSKNLDFDHIQTTTKYIRSEYNTLTGRTSEYEISEAEYENPCIGDNSKSYIETGYKRLSLNLTRTSTYYAFASVSNTWKVMPAVRSFDVIGIRTVNMEVVPGSQSGKQIYKINGNSSYSYVSYASNGTNINNQDNGFGISMNIVDSNINFLQLTLDADLDILGFAATVFASYQHATSNVTLAQSKNYSLLPAGLGNVFAFNNNIGSYYDGMSGIGDYYSS